MHHDTSYNNKTDHADEGGLTTLSEAAEIAASQQQEEYRDQHHHPLPLISHATNKKKIIGNLMTLITNALSASCHHITTINCSSKKPPRLNLITKKKLNP
jgi:hypothetical protein